VNYPPCLSPHNKEIIENTRTDLGNIKHASCIAFLNNKKSPRNNLQRLEFTGAGEEIRTLDPRLGNPKMAF